MKTLTLPENPYLTWNDSIQAEVVELAPLVADYVKAETATREHMPEAIVQKQHALRAKSLAGEIEPHVAAEQIHHVECVSRETEKLIRARAWAKYISEIRPRVEALIAKVEGNFAALQKNVAAIDDAFRGAYNCGTQISEGLAEIRNSIDRLKNHHAESVTTRHQQNQTWFYTTLTENPLMRSLKISVEKITNPPEAAKSVNRSDDQTPPTPNASATVEHVVEASGTSWDDEAVESAPSVANSSAAPKSLMKRLTRLMVDRGESEPSGTAFSPQVGFVPPATWR